MKQQTHLLILSLLTTIGLVHATTFKVDCRDRSPELILTSSGCLGPVAEIVESALKHDGHKVKWQHNSWDTTITAAETGDIDLVIRHSMNPERETFLQEVAYGYEIRLIYYFLAPRRDMVIRLQSDMNGLRVGAKEGSFYSPEFEQNTNIEKVLFADDDDIARALTNNEIDLAITSEAHGLERFRVIQGARAVTYTERFLNGRYISIPTNSKAARHFPALEAEINRMIKEGDIDRVFEQYGLRPPFQIND